MTRDIKERERVVMSGMDCCGTSCCSLHSILGETLMSCRQSEHHRFCSNSLQHTFLLVAEDSLMVDLRAELGTGESLRPLASDLARDEEEERREAEQGGST